MANTQVSDYEDEVRKSIEITLGQMDLNQFVLSMVSKQHGIPHSIQAHSVNSSDKKTILQAIQMVKESIDFEEDAYFVAECHLF